MSQTVRTRMAPSPTGEMHVGSFSIILKNFALARQNHGQFILRIEDTDKEREVPGAIERIIQTIKDYGLSFDEGPLKGGAHAPYVQSERLALYRQAALELVEKGQAYYCFCSKERLEEVRAKARAEKRPPKYDRYCRNLSRAAGDKFVIRLKVPDDRDIIFQDLIRGEIKINSNQIDDQVLLKSDGFPTYHLAVVVDDHDMKITHIMRGEEWLPSTPKHILLYEAFGWEPPVYAHIPVYLNPDGKGKMSKRKGDVSAQSYLQKGYLPEALLNFFMILGWTPQDQRDLVTLKEYVTEFNPSDISKKSVAFDIKKLNWLNGIYIRKLYEQGNLAHFWLAEKHHVSQLSLEQRIARFLPSDFPYEKLAAILALVYERLERLDQVEELSSFFYRDFAYDEEWKKLILKKADSSLISRQVNELLIVLQDLPELTVANLEEKIRGLQEKNDYHKGQYFMMLRLAVTGRKVSPPLFESMAVLGKELVLKRLHSAILNCGA